MLFCIEEHGLVDEASNVSSLGFHWNYESLKTHFFHFFRFDVYTLKFRIVDEASISSHFPIKMHFISFFSLLLVCVGLCWFFLVFVGFS
jgi:hypothetical protein